MVKAILRTWKRNGNFAPVCRSVSRQDKRSLEVEIEGRFSGFRVEVTTADDGTENVYFLRLSSPGSHSGELVAHYQNGMKV